MQSALILFGHGARDPLWMRPIKTIQKILVETLPGVPVCMAFLEFLSPSLDEAVKQLYAEGVREITVIPVFLAQSGHLKRDLPAIMQRIAQEHPGCRLTCTEALGEHSLVIQSMAQAVKQMFDQSIGGV